MGAFSLNSARRTDRSFAFALLAGGTFTTVFGAWIFLRWGGVALTEAIDDIGSAAVAFFAAAVCALAAGRQAGRTRLAWYLICGSALAWGLGESAWSYYEVYLRQQVPYPSLADAGYLAAVPLAVAGILLFSAENRGTVSRLAGLLDGAIIAGSLLVVSWAAVLGTVYRAGSGSLVAQLIGLAYPVSDVVILTMVLLLIGRVRRSAQLSLSLLAAGLAANLLSDSGFAYLTTVNSYGPAQPIDTGWVAGYLLIALAALRAAQVPFSRPGGSDQRAPRWRLYLPYLPVAAAAAVTGASELISRSIEPLLFWGLMTVALFVVIRQFMMLNDHITLNRELERQAVGLREREEHLRSLVEHSSDVVGVTDPEGVIRFQSTSAERIFGYSGTAWVGHRLVDLVHPADRPLLERRLDRVLKASGHPITVDCRLRHNLGSWTPCEITITNLLYLPSVQGLVLNIRDVSERAELEEKVSYYAVHDSLTNLANEAAFRAQLEQALGNPILARGIAVLILDLDDFKSLNDRLGSPVGDQVLVSVGARLEQMVRPGDAVRPGDIVARLRSDEFAILLRDMPNPEAAASVARRIMQQFDAPFRLGREEVPVAATIGAAGLISGAESVDDLLKHADLALRAARSGGVRYLRYQPEMPAPGFSSVA